MLIALDTDTPDWEQLARTVERSGDPIWRVLDGAVRGMLLPTTDAQRLMGRYLENEETVINRQDAKDAKEGERWLAQVGNERTKPWLLLSRFLFLASLASWRLMI